MPPSQLEFTFGPGRNVNLFSSHWLTERLHNEPDWKELHDDARQVLDGLAELWAVQRDRVQQYGDEQGLEQAFIQPVLTLLGWEFKYQAFLDGREPDYAFFLSSEDFQAALAAGRNSPDFWRTAHLTGDAKAWHISLDKPSVVRGSREYPPQQIEWYIDRSRCDFGYLTNGKLWRLVPREREPHQPRFNTYYEYDLETLLETWHNSGHDFAEQSAILEDFLPFYFFFGPSGYREVGIRKPLIQRALDGSSEYRLGIGESLPDRAFEALRLCIEGFLHFDANDLNHTDHLQECREQSFIFLYRLLFIMYAEDRGLLPFETNRTYRNNRSLRKVREEIGTLIDRIESQPAHDYSTTDVELYEHLLELFDLINRGHKTYGVPAYNGGLFDDDLHPFLVEKRISNWHLARVIDKLSRAGDPENPQAGLFRVDYRDLAIQHLGGIYEGLLELQPKYAASKMLTVARQVKGRLVEKVVPASEPLPTGFQESGVSYKQGEVYLETHKGERRASGSYYTPDHIVNYIVLNTLAPLCNQISQQLDNEIEAEKDPDEAARLRTQYDDRILGLRILDPAMGSGHFLIGACQYLAEEIATHQFTGDEAIEDAADTESAITFWKRRVVESSLYGVDINPLAVELAKLGLWLETVAVDQPLTFLDHHLRRGNSLIGAKISTLGVLPQELEELEEQTLLAEQLVPQVAERLPALLEPLNAISSLSSETTEQVYRKRRLYRTFDEARAPFKTVADLWCSTFSNQSELTIDQYQRAVELVARPRKFAALAQEPWFQQALSLAQNENLKPFHWELEFPGVFFDTDGHAEHPGFDAIIGNPPYDVLSERESGRDLSTLRQAIDHGTLYSPSKRGKNNLYKLFICRSVEILQQSGHLGFITPMSILGDKIVAGIRELLITSGNFISVDAFPQKDNARQRVFPQAKLSTAVFVWKKDQSHSSTQHFLSRQHPAQFIVDDSPSLSLTTPDISLYDPTNFTILSASQPDWDLVTAILRRPSIGHLSDVAEFFQGEVNETNERRRGTLTPDDSIGKRVTRGAGVCLYVLRDESQGDELFIDVDAFLNGKGEDTKAYHHKYARVAIQESSPQNNFRRIIAAFVPPGHYCNHTINYAPSHKCSVEPHFLIALLNTKLSDWFFRLGSTNAHVSQYQLDNLPCPIFSEDDKSLSRKEIDTLLKQSAFNEVLDRLADALNNPPFNRSIQDAIISASQNIESIESKRGEISRNERSALDPKAQPYQDFIDRLFYKMAGLTDKQISGLEDRLSRML